MTQERAKIVASAHNTWGIGGDDVMIVFEFPVEWGVTFESKVMRSSNKVYVDMNYTDARAFALRILEAANDAERIDREYAESQREYDEPSN